MTFKMDDEHLTECPQCLKLPDKQNRLVTEICGHTKCRRCFLTDEDDCLQCIQSPQISASMLMNDERKNVLGTVDVTTCAVCVSPNNIEQQLKPNGFVEYHCTVCKKHFSRTQQYYHLSCAREEYKKYGCSMCHKKFASRSHLNYHIESHENNSYRCSDCGKVFRKATILRKHEKHHRKPSVYCTICNKSFRHKVSLDVHVAKHRNELNFRCNFCEQRFANKSALQQHLLKHSEKKHKCNQCGQLFQRNSSLTLHMRRHAEIDNYKCSICNKVYKDANGLHRHEGTHIGTTKYKCIICDVKSYRKDTIIRHARIIHAHANPKACVQMLPQTDLSKNPEISNAETLEQQFSELSCEYIQMVNPYLPRTVANSFVIKTIGNVEPVVIPTCSKEPQCDDIIAIGKDNKTQRDLKAQKNDPSTFEPIIHKKLRKKYDPIEMYRKILNSSDETTQDEVHNVEVSDMIPPEVKTTGTLQRQRSQSNFTETHWRKNFKYTYQCEDY